MLVARHMRKHAKLDLRVVCIDKNVILVGRGKIFAEASSRLCPDRYILEVGIYGRESSRCGSRLLEGSVTTRVIANGLEESVNVGSL